MRAVALIALFCAATLSGCTSTAEGESGGGREFRWLTGELVAHLTFDVGQAEAATLRAFEDLDLVAVDDAVYGPKGKITGRMADGTEVRVRLRAGPSGGTEIAIRIGQIGDEAIARQVLRHIEREAERERR